MNRRSFTPTSRTTLRSAACLVAAATALALSGCNAESVTPRAIGSASASANPPSIAPPTTTASTSGTHTYTYRSTTKGCDLLDLDSLTTVLGDDAGTLGKPNYEKTSVATFARCARQYGAPASRSLVDIQIMVGKPDSASTVAGFWRGMRKADATDYTLTNPRLAAHGAYSWTDDQTGAHLAMYDGNLYVRISINQVSRQTVPATRVTELLNEIARNAMSTMAS